MATFIFELHKGFKTIDEKSMGGIDGYKAIHYACNWLSTKPPSNSNGIYAVHIGKKDKDGLYHYYCAVYRSSDGDYEKIKSGSDIVVVNPETGRNISYGKKKRIARRK